jgi:hypothetical protein
MQGLEEVMEVPTIFNYRFLFKASTPVRLPPFAGSTWRGAFGSALKRTICVMRDLDSCEDCLLYSQCAFPEIFVPPRPRLLSRRYGRPPPSFVFAPQDGGELSVNDKTSIELRLLGKANRHLPFVVYALKRAGINGMGNGRGRLELLEIDQLGRNGWCSVGTAKGAINPLSEPFMPPPPDPPPRVRVILLAPLRLKSRGRNVPPREFTADIFLGSLLRRIYLLSMMNNEGSSKNRIAPEAMASTVRLVDTDLHWREIVRRSSKQGLMRAGGIVGSFVLQGELAPFWQYLWYGQWLHVGHMACMGLGAYRLEAAKLVGEAKHASSGNNTAHA